MKFESLYNNVMKTRFLNEDIEDMGEEDISIPLEVGEPEGIDTELQKQESIEDEIIAYLKNLKDSQTTYIDLLRYVSRLRSVENPEDAKHHIIAALSNRKEDGLKIVKSGPRISDNDIISIEEIEPSEDEEQAYTGGQGNELGSEEHEDFSPEDRLDQAIRGNLPKHAVDTLHSYDVDAE